MDILYMACLVLRLFFFCFALIHLKIWLVVIFSDVISSVRALMEFTLSSMVCIFTWLGELFIV